jgi:hypothetical protein
MIARLLLSVLLFAVMIYAWSEYRRSPVVGLASMLAGAGGFYFVWFPARASALAELAGIGRGVDLILYTWVAISLLILLNLHLKLRAQMELITALAREMALADARLPTSQNG